MQIKVAEDLPRQVVTLLREKGFQVASVVDQAMSGWKDAELCRRILVENRFLITADKGFADIRLAPRWNHATAPRSGWHSTHRRTDCKSASKL